LFDFRLLRQNRPTASNRAHPGRRRRSEGTAAGKAVIGSIQRIAACRPTDDPKNKRVSVVPLAALARDILSEVPIIDARGGKDFVFTTTGVGPLKGWSKYKERLDGKMLALLRQWAEQRGELPEQVELTPWQHRDLRRTARTLMSRIGIDSKVAEHCLAHAPPGVEGIYDRYGYLPQKRDAFAQLAELVERIVSPPTANVVTLGRAHKPRHDAEPVRAAAGGERA
jgi:hypothetical protein